MRLGTIIIRFLWGMVLSIMPHFAYGQITYYHFDDVMNQFIGMESGKVGAVPEYLYHPHYKKYVSDPSNGKLNLRTVNYLLVSKEPSYSHKSDSVLRKRVKKEALNQLDRQPGVTSIGMNAAKKKVTNKLAVFKKNINMIPYYGGTGQPFWIQCYNALSAAYNITMKSYMRSGSRMMELQALYRDVVEYNSQLLKYLTSIANKKRAGELVAEIKNPKTTSRARRRAIAQQSMLYWGNAWGSEFVTRNYRK
ncbi:MAG: hypothetical protein PUD15_08785 [Prevotella sp.]|nr:hypothetical protein [Prevotella sp.]